MSTKMVMFFASMLLIFNFVCLIIDGSWFGSEDMDLMYYLTGMNAQGLSTWTMIFTVPIGFVTHGLPKMLFWDFSFFDGGLALIRWLLMGLSIAAVWGLARDFISAGTSVFGRR